MKEELSVTNSIIINRITTKETNLPQIQSNMANDYEAGNSISMQTIFKHRQSTTVREEHSEIFETAYNIHIRDGSTGPEYTHWESRKHLMATSICTSIGLGSLWRFPTYCYKYGGASFLYAYTFLMLLIGHPLFYFEIIMGQITPENPSTRFNICPFFEGLGWAMATMSSFILIYIGILCAYICIYLSKTISITFPWLECDHANKSCWNKSSNCQLLTPPEVFFYKMVMGSIKDEEESTWEYSIHWPVVAFLSLIWFGVYICTVINIRSSRLIPTFLFIILFLLSIPMIVGMQLTGGSLRGLEEYFVASPIHLLNFELWWSALEQVLYSLGLATGTCLSFGAYSQFMAPVYKDCIIICCVVLLISAVTGSIVFSGVGIMGKDLNEECLLNSVKKGPGSVLIFYSIAFAHLPVKSVWAFLIYLLAILVGMFTMVIVLETVTSILSESVMLLKDNRNVTSAVVSIVLFLCSLPGLSKAGKDMIIVLDAYGVGKCLSFIAIFEIVSIYFYGFDRLSRKKYIIFGKPIDKLYKYIWYYIPGVIMSLMIGSIFSRIFVCPLLEPFIIEGWQLSSTSTIVGWFLFSVVMFLILIKSIYNVYFTRKEGKKIKTLFFTEASETSRETFMTALPPKDIPEDKTTNAMGTANVNSPGPSSAVSGVKAWQKYYHMPSKYFKVFSSGKYNSEIEN